MKKFPNDIEAGNLILETLGLYDIQDLDDFVQKWVHHMQDPFLHKLIDTYETDGTLDSYSLNSFYRHKAKKAAEYIITRVNEENVKEITGYFNLQIKNDVGEIFVWVAPPARKKHILSHALKALEKTFFALGLKEIRSQCYFKNPYFQMVSSSMEKNNYHIVHEGSASVTWEKTANSWRNENERKHLEDSIQMVDKELPLYDDELKTTSLKLKLLEPTAPNVVSLLKFAQSAPSEKGYRPTCLNVHCLKSALFALQSSAKLKKEKKFCEYFLHVDNKLVGVIALREERMNESDERLVNFKKCDHKRKASCLYWTHPNYRGNGYMVEGLKLVTASFFAHGGDILNLDISPDNKASLKVAQKAGFKYDMSAGHYLTRSDVDSSDLGLFNINQVHNKGMQGGIMSPLKVTCVTTGKRVNEDIVNIKGKHHVGRS